MARCGGWSSGAGRGRRGGSCSLQSNSGPAVRAVFRTTWQKPESRTQPATSGPAGGCRTRKVFPSRSCRAGLLELGLHMNNLLTLGLSYAGRKASLSLRQSKQHTCCPVQVTPVSVTRFGPAASRELSRSAPVTNVFLRDPVKLAVSWPLCSMRNNGCHLPDRNQERPRRSTRRHLATAKSRAGTGKKRLSRSRTIAAEAGASKAKRTCTGFETQGAFVVCRVCTGFASKARRSASENRPF